MSADMSISQPESRIPATEFQADKSGSSGLNQLSKAKISRDSVKEDCGNFLNTLEKASRVRALTKRLKFAPDEPSPLTDEPFDVGEMAEASSGQIAPQWEFMAVIKVLQNLGFYDNSGRFDLHSLISGQHLVGRQAAPIKMLLARLQQNQRQAAILLRNGQHEAIIDLKSDFVGNIRMQVISENQKVTVRILVENGLAKDMIESNIHQLEADMLQQGLEVGKLEVAVSCNPEDSVSSKEKFDQGKAGQGIADRRKNDSEQPSRSLKDIVIIDYFA